MHIVLFYFILVIVKFLSYFIYTIFYIIHVVYLLIWFRRDQSLLLLRYLILRSFSVLKLEKSLPYIKCGYWVF